MNSRWSFPEKVNSRYEKNDNNVNKFMNDNSGRNNPFRNGTGQLTVGLKSTFLPIEMENYPARLEVICGQNIKSTSLCWFCRPELPLQINRYLNSHDSWLGSIRYTSQKANIWLALRIYQNISVIKIYNV